MATKKSGAGIEWVGGLGSMPAYVTGEGDPYRPEVLFWIGDDGAVLGATLGQPGEMLGLASENLRATIADPGWGLPHTPKRVRVASPDLAVALRDGHPTLDIVCAPTPEIDTVLRAMRKKMGDDAKIGESYLSPEVSADAIAALFRAAARLFRAHPWHAVPADDSLMSLTIEKLGVNDAVLSVIGQRGESLGVILFSTIDHFHDFLDAADAVELGERPKLPPHFALHFKRRAELSPVLRREIAEHHWKVAGARAYPQLLVVDEDLVARPPTTDEVVIAEAIALALPSVLSERRALIAAWNGGQPFSRTLSVHTHVGEIELSLRVLPDMQSSEYAPPCDVLAKLTELSRDRDEVDPDVLAPLEEELERRFLISEEAPASSDGRSWRDTMEFARSFFGGTIATIEPRELKEIVFDIIPRKSGYKPPDASLIIEQHRAFYTFLKREGLQQADACLRVLGDDAVEDLEAALIDANTFEWPEVFTRPAPPTAPSPPAAAHRPVDKAAARTKKNKRKSARQARKKNR